MLLHPNAHASGDASVDEQPEPTGETEAEAEGPREPRPHEASGVRVPPAGPSPWLWVPRIALMPVQLVANAVMVPILGAAYVYERLELRDRFYRIFFNDTETVGLYPVAYYESGFGLNAGARFVYRELFDAGGTLSMRVSYGGARPQTYTWKATSGDFFGRVELALRGSYESYASSRFFGLGNGDLVDPTGALIDPLVDDTAVATRFRHAVARARLSALVHLSDRFAAGIHGELGHTDFGDDPDLRGDADIAEVYDTGALVGFEDGSTSVYSELELRYDSRRVTRYYLSRAVPSTGWLASLFGGVQVDVGGSGRDPFARIAFDLQRFVDLYGGDRVLVARLFFEAVGGGLDDVPFTDLPALGGPQLLRGYRRDRFRDRRAGMLSLEYEYPISFISSGFVFGEAGRVWRDWDDLTSTGGGDLRVGYGGGIQFHGRYSLRARISVASSIDGGVSFRLGFDPAWEVRSRNTLF